MVCLCWPKPYEQIIGCLCLSTVVAKLPLPFHRWAVLVDLAMHLFSLLCAHDQDHNVYHNHNHYHQQQQHHHHHHLSWSQPTTICLSFSGLVSWSMFASDSHVSRVHSWNLFFQMKTCQISTGQQKQDKIIWERSFIPRYSPLFYCKFIDYRDPNGRSHFVLVGFVWGLRFHPGAVARGVSPFLGGWNGVL